MLTQVYPPDPAAVGQYFEDVAVELANRGHEVVVYSADRDYDNPSIKYDARSRHAKVRVVRLPLTSFGKRSILLRLLSQISYLSQASLQLLFARNVDGVLLTTIPATTGAFFLLVRIFRSLPFGYWVMDINPDQAVALGAFTKTHPAARILAWCNRKLCAAAAIVVTLDGDMADRLKAEAVPAFDIQRLSVIPPWPLEKDVVSVSRSENVFIKAQGWQKRFVFMYSGNHSMVHPLDTLLRAIDDVSGIGRPVSFAFIGGGRGKTDVTRKLSEWSGEGMSQDRVLRKDDVELVSLPYQPIDQLRYSLSAADIQIVSFGSEMVGIVHPSKFYGAMALAKPILLLGPVDSALGKLVIDHHLGWCVAHGDTEAMVTAIREACSIQPDELRAMGERARDLIKAEYSRDKLCAQFCDVFIEGMKKHE